MTSTLGSLGATVQEIRDPDDLQRVMHADFAVSDEQWAAVAAPLEPTVVIAGAGSGKTSLMAARVVYLVVTGQVEPDQVLGLTFTSKAAAELRGRIHQALLSAGRLEDPEIAEPMVSTYNAYAAGLLSEHGLRIGHEPDTRLLADASRYQLAARVVARHRGTITELSDHPETVIAALLALESAMSEHLVDAGRVRAFDDGQLPDFLAAFADEEAGRRRSTYLDPPARAISAIRRRRELLGLVADYREAKQRYGVMDFSDQIAFAARVAAEHPAVSRMEREKYRVVLLDEYQDTSVAQAVFLSRLFSGADVAEGRGHPVTAVGDPNQAIYGWRGASVANIRHFGDDFPRHDGSPEVRRLELRTNRRSDRRILEVANALAAPLHAADAGVRELVPSPVADTGRVTALVHEHSSHELAWLAEEVQASHRAMARPRWSEIGVLVRDNAHAAEVFDALSRAGVPVEIVGLNGLLRLPEVAEVVATLRLLHDLGANDALLTLLAGSRWRIGPRDLALLGRRAAELADSRGRRERPMDVIAELSQVAEGHDPIDLASLADALDDPGEAAYSAQARRCFGLLAGELRMLRGHVDEPILDLVRRIVDTCGIDVELAAAVSDAARGRRDNLDLFLKAVAEFQPVDGQVSLAALLAYLDAEDEMGTGLDVATPTEADSVKLLTVHRAKGLEWDVVFLVGAGRGRFPSTISRTLWTSSPAVLPSPLRGDADDRAQLRGHDKAALEEFRAASKATDAEEELRLGYVALTRARHTLWFSSYLWGARATAHGPSPYQETVREVMSRWGETPPQWHDAPEGRAPNPWMGEGRELPWPADGASEEAELRLQAAVLVDAVRAGAPAPAHPLDLVEEAQVAQWDDDLDRLLAEARADVTSVRPVVLPGSLSATDLGRLREDPDRFVADLVRPMPRRPMPAARTGTQFHAWVEARFDQQQLIATDDLADRGDVGLDDAELAELVAAFERGPFHDRVPLATEAPFALVLGGQVVRGRIDAVYDEPDGGYLVVDWKTSRSHTADPTQLAIYRLAWAELHGVRLDQVRAVFHYVRDGATIEPHGLGDRAALEAVLLGVPPAAEERERVDRSRRRAGPTGGDFGEEER